MVLYNNNNNNDIGRPYIDQCMKYVAIVERHLLGVDLLHSQPMILSAIVVQIILSDMK